MVLYITKRDGQRVLFDENKIGNAISKAFAAVEGAVDGGAIRLLCEQVADVLRGKYPGESIPSVEHTQDIVANIMLKNGHIDVARAYIRYRAKHEEARELRVLEEVNEKSLTLRGAQGESVPFNPQWIGRKLERLKGSLGGIATQEVVEEVCRNVYSNMPLEDVDTLLLNGVKQRIESHYNYSYLTARLVLDRLYQDVIGAGFGSDAMGGIYASSFNEYLTRGIDLELLSPALAEFDIAKLAAVDPALGVDPSHPDDVAQGRSVADGLVDQLDVGVTAEPLLDQLPQRRRGDGLPAHVQDRPRAEHREARRLSP